MKNIKLTFCLLLTSISLFAKNTPPSFQTSNIQAGIEAAAQSQKLLMAHFVADWCMPSRWMEEHAFNHPEIERFLTEDYLPIKVDIDQAAGFQDKEQYQVKTLPTILIFNAAGKVLERIEGITDIDELRQILRTYNLAVHKKSNKHFPQTNTLTSNAVDFSHLNRPAFKHSKQDVQPVDAQKTLSTPNLPMTLEEVYGAEPTTPSPSTTPKLEPNSEMYGVEVATLKQYGAVIKYVRSLERRISDKVFILLRQEQDQKAYHVIIGKVQNRQAAFELRHRLSASNIQGIVRVLDTI